MMQPEVALGDATRIIFKYIYKTNLLLKPVACSSVFEINSSAKLILLSWKTKKNEKIYDRLWSSSSLHGKNVQFESLKN